MNESKDIMTKRLITIKSDDSMALACRVMTEHGFRHLPVTDNLNRIIGILSDRDVQRSMVVEKTGPLAQTLSIPEDFRVEDFMNWPVYVVSETTSVKKIAEEMLAQKVSAFLVEGHSGKIAGIITTDDLLRLLVSDSFTKEDLPLKAISYHFLGAQN